MPIGMGRGLGVIVTDVIFIGWLGWCSCLGENGKQKGRHGFPIWGKIRDGLWLVVGG
jgi:hypothetical protein